MNRHQRRKARKTEVPRCKSCGERRGPQMAGSDGKMRCPICHNMHVGDAARAADTAVSPDQVLAQRLQEAIHGAVVKVTGGDPSKAAIVTNSLLASAATFALQTAIGSCDLAEVSAQHTTDWRRNFRNVAGDYHWQVCEAMQLPVQQDGAPNTELELPRIDLSSSED